MTNIYIFFQKKMHNQQLGNYKKKERTKSKRFLTGNAKNEIIGSSGPALRA